ncbi:MAG TPA: hypothetical protein VLU25_22075, partial [Acidobacteriota bacterium]|nr:hypothetical protein [Acidobacteriota bacterium]
MIYLGSTPEVLAGATLRALGGEAAQILEPSARLGGWAVTGELWPGIEVPLQTHHAGGLSQRIIDDLKLVEKHGLAFLDPPALAHAPAPGAGTPSLTIWREMDRTVEEIRRHSAEDAARWPDFCRSMRRHAAQLDELLQLDLAALLEQGLNALPHKGRRGGDGRSKAARYLLAGSTWSELAPLIRFAARLRRQGGPEMMDFLRVLPMTFKELMDEWFEAPLLRGLLGTCAVLNSHWGPQAAGTTLNFLYHLIDSPDGQYRNVRRIPGGLPALLQALKSAACDAGVEIALNADIRGHFEREGPSPNGWTSAYTPHHTHLHLLPPSRVTPALLRRLRPQAPRPVTTYLHLLLQDPSPPPDAESGHIVLPPSLEYIERASDAPKYGRSSENLLIDAFRADDQVLTLRLQYTHPSQS